MDAPYRKIALIFGVSLIAVGISLFSLYDIKSFHNPHNNDIHSLYSGQESRGIKALSRDDIEGLLAGSGTPFNGMAKSAELNGYPGPRHVLDAHSAGEFDLSNEQREQIEALYEEMRSEAIKLGTQIIAIEKDIDNRFAGKTMTNEILQDKVTENAELYGMLRVVHLKTHLSMVDVLSLQQVDQYNKLRGYTSGTPCDNIPEGHDPEMWKLHNNCD